MNMLETFIGLVKGIADENGVYPQQGVFRTKDDRYETCAFAMSGYDLWPTIARRLRDGNIKEYIFGMDLKSIKNDGTEFTELLLITYVKENKFHIGVLEYMYDDKQNIIWKDINWNNEFYNKNFRAYNDMNLSSDKFEKMFLV